MTKAMRIHQTGGPEVMQWDDVTVGEPGPGEIRLRQAAIGLNYLDTYHRSGLYPLPMPAIIGGEGAGIVEAVGAGVTDFKAGDRVGYNGPLGAYAETRLLIAERAVKLPDGIDDRQAAAMFLKGTTAYYLLFRTYKVQPGDTILVHAAAGGVGLIMCQWAKALGATVIGTVGSDAKAKLAADHGCDHPIVYTRENFVERVKQITGGEGLPVVYDSIGKDTFLQSLDCLRPLGMMVSFGNASGPVANFNLGILAAKGSLFVTRPTGGSYFKKRADMLTGVHALFDAVKSGKVKIEVNQTYALKDAVKAHQDLEARKTTGSTLLIP